MKISSETGKMILPPLAVFARTAAMMSGIGIEILVSSVGEQNAHWRPQPRFISTMPYVERLRGTIRFSTLGSGAATVGGKSWPSSASWKISRIFDSALPLMMQSTPSRSREPVLSICQAPAPPTTILGLCFRIAGCR